MPPLNLPLALTWLRILLIPIFVGVFYVPAWHTHGFHNILATALFGIAAATDWLDGYLARRWNQTSAFGAFLDPVADKLMVAAAMIVLVDFQRTYAVWALIIIGREMTISALREWMAQLGKSKSVAVSYIGKLKTAAQMLAITFLLWQNPLWGINIAAIGQVLMIIAAILTLWSMCYYLWLALPLLQEPANEEPKR